ncbi:MAG: hypothetical protein U1E14_21350 [Geminicoccaceae bacterium]
MMFRRRTMLGAAGGALLGNLVGPRGARAADLRSLTLYQRLGKPSFAWQVSDLLQPVLVRLLGIRVDVETAHGEHGLAAINAILDRPADQPGLVITSTMGPQYVETVLKPRVRIADLTPVAKLTNGFSVTTFARRGGELASWQDLAALRPLTVSCMDMSTAPFVAKVMMEGVGGLALEVTIRESIPAIVDDVVEGRCHVGIIPTSMVVENLDRLQPLVSFGARRNAILRLTNTPTFAEITGNPKLAFTESIGAFAAPGADPALVARLAEAILAAGRDQDVIDRAEATELPIAINGADVLVDTIARNERVLKRILPARS